MENRLVLGIDNSMDFLNIALSLDGRLLEERHISSARHPSEIIAVQTRDVLQNHNHTISDVTLIAITLGPGSFTGIRVGLAFCKGLNAGSSIPLVGVPTLDVLAAPFSFMDGHYLCPVIDAKKSEVFSALYYVSEEKIRRLTEYGALKPEKLGGMIKTPCLCFGTGAALCEPFLSGISNIRIIKEGFSNISGKALIREGLRRESIEEKVPLQPVYGRKSEAEIKFNVTIE